MKSSHDINLGGYGSVWKFYDRQLMPYLQDVKGATRFAQLLQRRALKKNFRDNEEGYTAEIFGEKARVIDLNDFKYFLWEPEFVERFLEEVREAEVVADVGSFHGFYSLLADTCAKPYAFEIDPDNIEHLKQNIQLNFECSIDLVEKAVWSENTSLDINTGKGGKSSVKNTEGNQVEAVKLDTFFEERQDPDLIKIDVEGAEGHVLHGAEQILRDNQPSLLIEWHPDRVQRFGQTKKEIEAFLKGLGYTQVWNRQRKAEGHGLYKHRGCPECGETGLEQEAYDNIVGKIWECRFCGNTVSDAEL